MRAVDFHEENIKFLTKFSFFFISKSIFDFKYFFLFFVFFCFSGEVFYAQRSAWIATGIVFIAILPILMCIVCAIYCYRKKARKVNPGWVLSLPRSRAGSRTTLRQMASDGSDSDTLKKSRSYEKVYRTNEPLEGKPNIEFPAKKWDLDEEDFTSSEGGSEFPQGKIAKDINYIGTADDTVHRQQQQPQQQQQVRQTGRRNQREAAQQQQQLQQQVPDSPQDESYLAQAPESLSPGFSPVYSGFGGGGGGDGGGGGKVRPPSGGIRVLPATTNKYFTDNTGSPISSGSPTLTQAVGLPSPPLNNRSTQV